MSEPRYTPTPGGIYPTRSGKKTGNKKARTTEEELAAQKKEAEKSLTMKIISIVWKSILVGLIYLLCMVFFGGLMLGFGAELPELKRQAEVYLLELIASGAAIAALLGPLHSSMHISMNRRFLSITLIIFLTSTALLIEETFFTSGTISHDMLPGLIVQHFLVALMTGYSVAALFGSRELRRSSKLQAESRSVPGWIWRIGASITGYLLFDYVTNQLRSAFVFQPWFQSYAGGGVIPGVREFSVATLAHGCLMIGSIVPLILQMRSSTARKMISGGTVLFLIGGIVPILSKIIALPWLLMIVTVTDCFLRDFLTGFLAALLLARKMVEVKAEPPIKRG